MTRSYRRRSIPPAGRKPMALTLEQARVRYEEYQASRNLSPNTRRSARDCLALFATFWGEERLVGDITTEECRAFHAWLQSTPMERVRKGSTTRTPGGIAARMRALRAFVRWLEEEGHLTTMVRVREPAVPKELFEVLTDAELSTVLSSSWCDTSEQGTRNRALFSLMLDTGLRVGEVVMGSLRGEINVEAFMDVVGRQRAFYRRLYLREFWKVKKEERTHMVRLYGQILREALEMYYPWVLKDCEE